MKELRHQLLQTMKDFPPDVPSCEVVNAFLGLGDFRAYLQKHVEFDLIEDEKEGFFDPIDIFSHFIDAWMQSSLVALFLNTPNPLNL